MTNLATKRSKKCPKSAHFRPKSIDSELRYDGIQAKSETSSDLPLNSRISSPESILFLLKCTLFVPFFDHFASRSVIILLLLATFLRKCCARSDLLGYPKECGLNRVRNASRIRYFLALLSEHQKVYYSVLVSPHGCGYGVSWIASLVPQRNATKAASL